tara:strand:+ start:853 stop:1170 length:318 start_codon:yes stop_codon:yes gene_type:complete
MRDTDGKRMVAYNCDVTDATGIIHCIVKEDEAGYRPMTGTDPMQMPWYFARWDNHLNENGTTNHAAARAAAEKVVDKLNERDGYSKRDVMDVVASSMRAQNQRGD